MNPGASRSRFRAETMARPVQKAKISRCSRVVSRAAMQGRVQGGNGPAEQFVTSRCNSCHVGNESAGPAVYTGKETNDP